MNDIRIIELSSPAKLPDFPILKRLYTGEFEQAMTLYHKRYNALPEVCWHTVTGLGTHCWWTPVP